MFVGEVLQASLVLVMGFLGEAWLAFLWQGAFTRFESCKEFLEIALIEGVDFEDIDFCLVVDLKGVG